MDNDTAQLTSSDIADMLGFKTVTIRKYASALEKAGYNVQRSEGGHRVFTERDAMVFQQVKSLCDRSGMSVEKASNIVASKHQGASESVAVTAVSENLPEIQRYEERYNEMSEKMDELIHTNKVLTDRMDQQNENMTAILREILLTKQMIAAAQSKKWWQFWKREVLSDPNDPEYLWKLKNGR